MSSSRPPAESADTTPAPATGQAPFGRAPTPRGYLLAGALLVGALLLVGLFWQQARERELEAARLEFEADAAEVLAQVRQRLVQVELTTRGGVALFGTVARPTPRQWQAYVDGIDIQTRFPAMAGLGFADQVSRGGLVALQIRHRDSGYGLLEVWPRGVRGQYAPIIYLQPETVENVAAIGFDLYAQPVRRAALEAARDNGEARLSGAVELVQDRDRPDNASSVLLVAPVYRAGDYPRNVQARRLSLQGWVYAPLRMRPLVQAALRDDRRDLRFSIRDVSNGGNARLYTDPPRDDGAEPAFTHSLATKLYGRRWRLDFRSAPLTVAAPGLVALRTTVLVGLFAAMLLFGLAMLLARTEARARAIAERMTEDYRRSELRFRNAMQYAAIGMALLDHEDRIVETNPALGRIVGREPDALTGESFEALFDIADVRHVAQPIGEGAFRQTRQLHRGADGELRHAQLVFAPIPGKLGQDVVRLVQVEDVTERLHAQAQVLALNRTLEARVKRRTRALSAANQELEALAYSISHDLRAPLRAIEGFSRLLADSEGGRHDAEGRDYLERIRKAAARMGELIESILKMSRLGRGELKPAAVDLTLVAAEVAAELRDAAPEREVEFVIASGLHAHGDPSLLRNLLQNLLGNAWKFTAERAAARIKVGRGRVDIDGDGKDEEAFYVRDNGAGFEPEYVGKLFRPFQRLHSQEQFAGHGIGLASVKRIVDRHGGKLLAQGRKDEGATFWFTLPEHADAEHPEA